MGKQDRKKAADPPPAPAPERLAPRIADGIVEAGWLLAAALVPVFFDIHSGRPFEPDKTALLRLLAALVAAAGLARFVEGRFPGAPAAAPWRWRDTPLPLAAALYVGAALLSTLFSIAPRLSFWGSYTRLDGLVTLLAHVTIFTAVAARLRTRAQWDRLLDAVVAASLPVCAYGIAQASGLETLSWTRAYQEWRISTTLGNPIFAGSYLVLVLPVTVGALLSWWTRRGEPGRGARLAVYAVAALAQVATLGLTGSRGPWLAAAVAAGALALLLAAVQGRRRLAGTALGAGIAGLAFVALLNVPGGPLERLRSTPVLGRLAHLFARRDQANPGDRARVLVWQGALRLTRLPAPIVVPGHGPDGAAALRPVVGFGAETMQDVFGAVYDPAFEQAERRNPDISAEGVSIFSTRVPDRSHNEVLDSLVTGGVLGLAAFLALAAAAQATGLGALGLLGEPRERRRLAVLCAAGGLSAVVAVALAFPWAYVGIALALGLAAGWAAFMLWRALSGSPAATTPAALAIAGITAALLGHFVEIQFGPAVVTSRLYFWILAGLLVAAARGPAEDPAAATATDAVAGARLGLLAAALGVTIAFGFAGFKASGGGKPGHTAIAVFAGLAALALAAPALARVRVAAAALALAAGITSAFGAYHLSALRATSLVHSVDALPGALAGLFTGYVVAVLALAIAGGVALGWTEGARADAAGLARGGALVAAALALAVPATLAGVNADVQRNFAATFQGQGRFVEAVRLFEAATRTAPWEPRHFQGLGEALLAASRTPAAGGKPAEVLRRADIALTRARALDPLALDHTANLARLARRRAEIETGPDAAAARTREAVGLYDEVLQLAPRNTLLLNEAAELRYLRLADWAGAEAMLERSRALDPSFDYTYAALGDLFAARGRATKNPDDLRTAIRLYQEARQRRPSLKAIISVGLVARELGDRPRAIGAFQEALSQGTPFPTQSMLYEQLAGLHKEEGDAARATHHAVKAMQAAAEADKPALRARLRALGVLPDGL
ncbi:MAG: tetratricopeptide repeat protein [Vicinamibacteria bacterium]